VHEKKGSIGNFWGLDRVKGIGPYFAKKTTVGNSSRARIQLGQT
jgi:hypothetical protein